MKSTYFLVFTFDVDKPFCHSSLLLDFFSVFRYPDSSRTHWRFGRQFVPEDSVGQEPHSVRFLPDRRRSLEYELRPRGHDRELVHKVNSLTESNFLIRHYCIKTATNSPTLLSLHVSWLFCPYRCSMLRFDNVVLNEYYYYIIITLCCKGS